MTTEPKIDDGILKQRAIDEARRKMAQEIVDGQAGAEMGVEEWKRFAHAWIVTAAQRAANETYYREQRDAATALLVEYVAGGGGITSPYLGVRARAFLGDGTTTETKGPPTEPPMICDHECTRRSLGSGITQWCTRCGAVRTGGDPWETPLLIALLAQAVRDRDAMCETLTIAQEAGTKLVEENRLLRARAARFGG